MTGAMSSYLYRGELTAKVIAAARFGLPDTDSSNNLSAITPCLAAPLSVEGNPNRTPFNATAGQRSAADATSHRGCPIICPATEGYP